MIELAAFALFGVGCTSIGISAVWKQEIKVSSTRTWRGKSTLCLGIPLLVVGIGWFGWAAWILLR